MNFASKALRDVTFFPLWLDHPDAPNVEPQLIGHASADLLIVGEASPVCGRQSLPRKHSPSAMSC